MSSEIHWRGIFTIPSTPFHQDGTIDIDGFKRIIHFCIGCGAHGLVYPVNASEFSALSDAERMDLSRILVEENSGAIPAVIGVAGVSKEAAGAFAAHAKDIGADAVIAMPPYVRRAKIPQEEIFDYYKHLSDVGGLPIFIQNYIGPVGTEMTPEFMTRMCTELEWVQYIKEETVPSTIMLSRVKALSEGTCKGVFGGAGGRYLIEEHRRGSDGNMPGCHVTDVVVALWNALESGDAERAMTIYKDMAPLFFFEHQLSGCYKEVLKRRGIIKCSLKRNGEMPFDDVSSKYLDEILESLQSHMTYFG